MNMNMNMNMNMYMHMSQRPGRGARDSTHLKLYGSFAAWLAAYAAQDARDKLAYAKPHRHEAEDQAQAAKQEDANSRPHEGTHFLFGAQHHSVDASRTVG